MAREVNRLNARAVATINEHGRHADGGGLYLSISPNGGRRWVFLFRWHGKPTEIGFGSARDVTLARARELASQARSKLAEGITTDDVLSVLRPLWQDKPETASRLRGRIERVLDAAKAQGLRSGENPARWRGNLGQLLPKRQRLTRGHHAAMGYADVPAFVAELQVRQATAALALEFAVLTAARSGEVLGA